MGPGGSSRPLDIDRLSRLGRFDVSEVTLHGAEGGLQALLFPAPDDRFSVMVDPEPPRGWDRIDPPLRPALREHRLRFRVCHEVAHSFFFDRTGAVPVPVVGPSPRQERFCDGFASTILVPPEIPSVMPPTAASVVELQERFRVSLEVAARAFAAVHRDAAMALYVTRGEEPPLLQWTNRRDDKEIRAALTASGSSRGARTVAWLEERCQALAVATA